jgi:tight adherence protein C
MSEASSVPALVGVACGAGLAVASLAAALVTTATHGSVNRPFARRLTSALGESAMAWWPEPARRRCLAALERAGGRVATEPEASIGASLVGTLCIAAGAGLVAGPWAMPVALFVCAAWALLRLRDLAQRAQLEIVRDLPVAMDFIAVAVEGGRSVGTALEAAVERLPPGRLRAMLGGALAEVRAGRTRADALRALAESQRVPALNAFVQALVQSERSGGALASVLRAQAAERLEERFARAERLAMESPVKLLVPLVTCIFPCTLLVLAFPIAMRLLQWS